MRDYMSDILELFISIIIIMNVCGLLYEFIEYITLEPIEKTTTTIWTK